MSKKRFSVTVEDKIQLELDSAKEQYYKETKRADMIRDLILRGLSSSDKESLNNQDHKDR